MDQTLSIAWPPSTLVQTSSSTISHIMNRRTLVSSSLGRSACSTYIGTACQAVGSVISSLVIMAFLTEYKTIVIIHFGLLLLERTSDSYGHDLWNIYNVFSLSWTIHNSLYFHLSTNEFSHWILIGS